MFCILLVFGTRPEAIKMCPLLRELKSREGFHVVTAVSGQHREMLDDVLRAFDVKPDYDLDLMREGQGQAGLVAAVLEGISRILEREKPDLLLVHGDTTTAFAAAQAGFYARIPVGHVEAGLRTYDMHSPFPEEFNRQAIGLMASYHFAPTERAADHLRREGKGADSVFVTGNTGIDALKYTVRRDYSSPLSEWGKTGRLVLLTLHRRENQGRRMEEILGAIRLVARERESLRILFPVHPNPAVRRVVETVLGDDPYVRLCEPLGVVDFHNLMAQSEMILTDSGGIQEEATALGIPTLVLRDCTERPEGIAAGALCLAGTSFSQVYRHFSALCDSAFLRRKMKKAGNPFGDGCASARIADIIAEVAGKK